MHGKSIVEVEESVQTALEALPAIFGSGSTASVNQQLIEAVKVLVPAGYRPVVELQENGRRKRRTASADNWSPETGEIVISFSREDPVHPLDQPQAPPAHDAVLVTSAPASAAGGEKFSRSGSQMDSIDARETDLCRALEEVERQGRAFIALKWFRDDVLAATGFAWASDAEQRQTVLASAIAKGLVLTSRIPNPRSSFPTTAIRVNRTPPAAENQRERYSPVRIQGEPLSSTILRDRGTY